MNNPAVVTAFPAFAQRGRIEEPILIGKDILELLTGAMYVDPLCVYREYIQNACDAIDEAAESGLYGGCVTPAVDISINLGERSVKIRDTGIGVPQRNFVHRLTAIGGSKKRERGLRGFRGVGRLSGLGYCQELIFRSRSSGDSKVSELVWSGRRLKDLIRSADQSTSLVDAIREVAEIRALPGTEYPEHFFEVELSKVTRVKNDVLLNEEDVRGYLSQVAPVPFHPEFRFRDEIESLLGAYKLNQIYTISLNDGQGQLYRPFRNTFPINDRASDGFVEFRPLVFASLDGEEGAVGWVLDHSYLGSIPRRTLVPGLRLRTGNVQVGSSDQLAPFFPEPRFNGWCVGELHIVDRRVIPNGRRDDFEPSAHYQHLLGQLGPLVRELTKTCRDKSIGRNKLRRVTASIQTAREAISFLRKNRTAMHLAQLARERVNLAFKEVAKLSVIRAIDPTVALALKGEIEQLSSQFERLQQRGTRSATRHGASAVKQAAQEEVLGLVYGLSENLTDAHRLVARITKALARNLRSRKKRQN